MMSRGSVIPVFLNTKDQHFNVTTKDMTRFSLTLDDSVKSAFFALNKMQGGEIFIPKAKSYKISDLAKAIDPKKKLKIVGKRPGEKVNEVLPDVDAKSFVEVDKAEFQQELVKLLRTSMAYSAEMLKEKAANNWASSFVSSMDGGKFFRPADGSPPIADATFETIFVAVVGTRLAYVLIIDED